MSLAHIYLLFHLAGPFVAAVVNVNMAHGLIWKMIVTRWLTSERVAQRSVLQTSAWDVFLHIYNI